jgi:hypothetical protein
LNTILNTNSLAQTSYRIRNPSATKLTTKERISSMAPELSTDPTNPWLGQPAMPEEEDQPLTLGQRIAAKAKPAPVMPAQPEPPPDVKPTFDPKLMPSGVLVRNHDSSSSTGVGAGCSLRHAD